jgi:hypothetical protein
MALCKNILKKIGKDIGKTGTVQTIRKLERKILFSVTETNFLQTKKNFLETKILCLVTASKFLETKNLFSVTTLFEYIF